VIHYITTNGIGNAWVAEELHVIGDKGVPFELHSLRSPHQNFYGSEWSERIDRETHILYPLPVASFLLSQLLAPLLFGTAYFAALANALFGERESSSVRVRVLAHFFVACHWARGLRSRDVSLIHAQWIHSAGSVAMYGAWLLRVPFSFTGHAVDLFRDRAALADKVRRADRIICISRFHRDLYEKTYGAPRDKLTIVYCGIELDRYPYRPRAPHTGPVRILSVGRLVEKKGFGPLIEACHLLEQRGLDFECVIGGSGPLLETLRAQVSALGLDARVSVTGEAIPQSELWEFLTRGDVFAQPCVWSKDDDVDGTPRTLMEAMATGCASISTRIAGIPDIIEHGVSGLLVEPEDAVGLAAGLEQLIRDPALRAELSRSGRKQIEEHFEIQSNLDVLASVFRDYVKARERTA